MVLIFVCQPFPCDLKKFTTSGVKRIDTGILVGDFWGPRALVGRIVNNSLSVRGRLFGPHNDKITGCRGFQ